MNIDPRLSVIDARLAGVKNIIAVTGWKGGIGKSSVSAVLALLLAERGFKTGLMDLDFTGACDHLILGAGKAFPKEIKGLKPPLVAGIRFMSASFFAGGKAVPLRGAEISEAMLELLAVTQWGSLDYLVIDAPPGLSDASLNLLRWIKRVKFLVVATPSKLSVDLARRSARLLCESGAQFAGFLSNMANSGATPKIDGLRPLGSVRYDSGLEAAYSNPAKLLKTEFAADLAAVAERLTRT